MKAITLHQPWASLVAYNIKTIETRGWRTKHRGPLAIHAAARPARDGECPGNVFTDMPGGPQFWLPDPFTEDDQIRAGLESNGDIEGFPIPYGAVVATCTLVDVVPMVEHLPPQSGWREPWQCITVEPWPILHQWPGFGSAHGDYIGDQAPYGDFGIGRFAWMLADIKRVDPPVPARGRQQLWDWEPA